MVPEGWNKKLLSDLAQVTSGGTPDTSNHEYWGGNIPWVTTAEIRNCIINDTQEKITALGLANSSAKLFPRGTILLAMYGQGKTRGQVARLGIEAATNQACAAILPKENVSGEYLYQNLLGRYEEIRNLSNDGSQKNLSGGLLKGISILRPPLPEQEKIARILGTWDRAIATIQALVENSEAQRQSLTPRLVSGRVRLKGYDKEWQTKRLSEISTRITRRNDAAEHPILTISSSVGFVEQKDKYRRFMAGKSLEDYVLLKRGEFAYNKGNSKTFQFGCIFPLEDFELALVPHVYVCFELNPDLHHAFFKHLFAADYLRSQLGRLVNTGVRNNGLLNITPRQFLGTTVPIPPLKEQIAIAKVLDALESQSHVLQERLAGAQEEKRALMQELLTGRRRVKLENIPGPLAAIG